MNLRLYTVCALSVTISAVAGLFVGGFIASSERDEPKVAVSTVGPTAPEDVGARLR
ncbi:MAG: hypothetical protein IJH84_01820 [Saccharopolyspora sp.]|uniref:hypothetical protein n=1 Tax=Saccharopolyspora TaxID=1835 RepID=UPI00190D3B38|nr:MULTISPECIES: hypothetical protein [unclassified Saccharopolyspora]MBK0870044.1 hypothetical protein [Saccharopolyspora sp. HNM0986]MBQ6639753.1 hypothetical protein [Saccharopolyspora sp.]